MSQSQHSFPYGLEIMMFWVMQQLVETDPITPLQVWLVLVLMRHMIFGKYTDVWRGKRSCNDSLCKYSSFFYDSSV
jgi:hypothetical protein